jgi:hypothetical protein
MARDADPEPAPCSLQLPLPPPGNGPPRSSSKPPDLPNCQALAGGFRASKITRMGNLLRLDQFCCNGTTARRANAKAIPKARISGSSGDRARPCNDLLRGGCFRRELHRPLISPCLPAVPGTGLLVARRPTPRSMGARPPSPKQPPRQSFFASISLGRISLLSRLVVNFLHQRLKRAPADLTQVPVVIGHELLAVAGAVHADTCPSEVVVGFTETAIADEGRSRSHTGD